MSSFQFIYSGSDTRKITGSDRGPVIISGDSNSTTFKFKFPESHKGYKKTIEWDFWIKDPEGKLINPSYPLVNDEHIIPGEVTYFNPGKQVGFSLIFERDDDPLFRERSTIYPIYVSKGIKRTENVSISNTLMEEVYLTFSKVEEHTSDVDNPHSVTKAQVGLGNADNTSDLDKPISTAVQTALDAMQDNLTFDDVPTADSDNPVKSGGIYDALQAIEGGDLTLDDVPVEGSDNPVKSGGIYDALNTGISSHANKKDNPHSVTKDQVGLSNVDNTSDIAKPISTAMQTALNAKASREYVDGELGTMDYNELENRPRINSVELINNVTFPDLGMESIENDIINNLF